MGQELSCCDYLDEDKIGKAGRYTCHSQGAEIRVMPIHRGLRLESCGSQGAEVRVIQFTGG